MSMRKKTVTISFVTTPELEAVLRKAANDQDRSLSWLIGKAIEKYFSISEPPVKTKSQGKTASR
ncbi:MAG TPA: hypothetical protein DCL44_06205 [Elusimicrobia bacterium]|nr:hypothetical protein [Elusimicrobiota bacterium]